MDGASCRVSCGARGPGLGHHAQCKDRAWRLPSGVDGPCGGSRHPRADRGHDLRAVFVVRRRPDRHTRSHVLQEQGPSDCIHHREGHPAASAVDGLHQADERLRSRHADDDGSRSGILLRLDGRQAAGAPCGDRLHWCWSRRIPGHAPDTKSGRRHRPDHCGRLASGDGTGEEHLRRLQRRPDAGPV